MFRRLQTLLRSIFRRREMDADLDDEIRFHLSEEADEREAAGANREEALIAAQKDLGSSTWVREAAREAWGGRALDGWLQDWRFAVRSAKRAPGLSIVIVMTLALAVGLNTAVFTFVNAILLRGLPFDQPDRIVSLANADARGRPLGVSRLDFLDWREQVHSLSGIAAYQYSIMNVADGNEPAEMWRGPYCTSNLFSLVGVRPMIGRDFTAEDEQPAAEAAVILGHALWVARYGASPAVIGRLIRVNGTPARVVGVMPKGIHFPNGSDLWMPWSALPAPQRAAPRQARTLSVVGRLAPGVTLNEAHTELQVVGRRTAQAYPASDANLAPTIEPYRESDTAWLAIAPQRVRLIFFSLWGAVSAVLLIACANVANLLLLRGSLRSREIAIRLSLGAGRWRIARQLLVESAALAAAGTVAGFGIAVVAVRGFGNLLATHPLKPAWMTFDMDVRVFWYVVLAGAATTMLSGLLPAIQMSRVDTRGAVEELGGRATVARRATRWTSPLTVVEIALTIMLLAAAGFTLRSFLTLYSTDVGVDTSHLMAMSVYLPLTKYLTPQSRTTFFDRLQERFAAVPGAQSCALATNYPLAEGGALRTVSVEGLPPVEADRAPRVVVTSVSSNFFDVLGARVLAGRALDSSDDVSGHVGAVVNERFASMLFAGQAWTGRQITLAAIPVASVTGVYQARPLTATVVGVVPNLGQRAQDEASPIVYLPYHVQPQPGMFAVVRTLADDSSAARALQQEMRAEDPDVPLMEIQTMDDLLARSWWAQRVFGSMFTVFAAVALALSAIGLYAGISYTVARRTSEIGVRLALGATAASVLWTVAQRSLRQLAVGVPLGVAGAFAVGQILQSMLVRASGRDPLTVFAIAAVMITVACVACIVPARRATRLDPVAALRVE